MVVIARTAFAVVLIGALLPWLLASEVSPDMEMNAEQQRQSTPLQGNNGVLSQTRIVGGNQANRDVYPFFTTVYNSGRPSYICGGSLIHSDVVLTAGTSAEHGHDVVT
jgi:secreted trypsin-like serine protease